MNAVARLTVIGLALFSLGWEQAKALQTLPEVPTKALPVADAEALAPPLDGAVTTVVQEVGLPVTAASESDAATPHPLDELAWMVGDWVDQDEEATIESSVNWTKNGTFLTRSFRVITKEEQTLSGMQMIGWDPAEQTIRSWIYDSDGGFGEGVWRRSGDRWTIRSKFTMPSGEKASAINIMRYIDDNEYGWRSVNRVVAGELKPDVDEVIVARQSAGSIPVEAAAPALEEVTAPDAEPAPEAAPPAEEATPVADPTTSDGKQPKAEPGTEPAPAPETVPSDSDGGNQL